MLPGKTLILDEGMSSVDEKTEPDMQGIIDSECKKQMIISVLHCFDHIHSYDKVVVMGSREVVVMGSREVVECGTPDSLSASHLALHALYNAQEE